MILSTETRKSKLSALRQSAGEQTQKLFYKGQTQLLQVYRIDLDYLIYNRHNGRLEAEMLTWEQENAISPDLYDEALHQKIDDLLWNSNLQRNKHTLSDLERKGQQRPGIVSLDGVVIDGNRRAMLLRRLERQTKQKQYFDGIILPDAYADNQAEIVRLETQYQLGEDSKVEYGPLQKYLHARRLCRDLNISPEEVDELMDEGKGNTKRLLGIMDLMDDYLEHIQCPRLYTLLGTKEGMFVDLYADLNRLQRGSANNIDWSFDETDLAWLRAIHFDYIRGDDFFDATKKSYRDISHGGKGKNFFANKENWDKFREDYAEKVLPKTDSMGSLEEYMQANPDYPSKEVAAKARDEVWKSAVGNDMKQTFGQAQYRLKLATEELQPNEYLRRAKDLLERISLDNPALISNENRELAIEINRLSYEMKKLFEKSSLN